MMFWTTFYGPLWNSGCFTFCSIETHGPGTPKRTPNIRRVNALGVPLATHRTDRSVYRLIDLPGYRERHRDGDNDGHCVRPAPAGAVLPVQPPHERHAHRRGAEGAARLAQDPRRRLFRGMHAYEVCGATCPPEAMMRDESRWDGGEPGFLILFCAPTFGVKTLRVSRQSGSQSRGPTPVFPLPSLRRKQCLLRAKYLLYSMGCGSP